MCKTGASTIHQLIQMELSPLFGVTALNFAYGFMLSNQGLLLAPLEAEELFPHKASLGLAGLAVCGGIAQLCGPAAGRWSDQYRAIHGRRLPCVLHASVIVVLLTGLLPLLSAMHFGLAFVTTFFLQQIAWNVLQTTNIALVPDLVPVEQRGTAGGLTAANTLVGALGGLLAVRFIGGDHIYKHYAIAMALTVLCVAIVYLTTAANESERRAEVRTAGLPETAVPHSWLSGLLACYRFEAERYPEFAKLLISKSMYSASVMVKGYLLFFVQDTFKLHDLLRSQEVVGNAAVAAEATAAVAAGIAIALLHRPSEAAPSGKDMCEVADSAGIAQARWAGASGALWMSLLWFGPPLVGYGVLRESSASLVLFSDANIEAISQHWVPWMVAGTATWGLGQGLYLAGDQALGYALLPDKNEASRYLGLTSVYSSLGAVLGGMGAGGLLHAFGSLGRNPTEPTPEEGPGYGYPGYAAMFFFATCLGAGSSRMLSSIRTGADKDMCGEHTYILQ